MTAYFGNFAFRMTKALAYQCNHPGPCDDDVERVSALPEIRRQLDKLGADAIRAELHTWGAWDDDELADDAENRLRLVWIAAGDIVEELHERKK